MVISLLCPVCGNPVDVAIDGGCTKECDDIFHGIEQTEENKMTLAKAEAAGGNNE